MKDRTQVTLARKLEKPCLFDADSRLLKSIDSIVESKNRKESFTIEKGLVTSVPTAIFNREHNMSRLPHYLRNRDEAVVLYDAAIITGNMKKLISPGDSSLQFLSKIVTECNFTNQECMRVPMNTSYENKESFYKSDMSKGQYSKYLADKKYFE